MSHEIWSRWFHIWQMPHGKSGHMLLVFSWQSQFFRNQYSSHLFFPGTLIKPWYPIKNVHGCSKSQVSASLKRPNHNYIRAVQRNIKVKSTQNMKSKETKNEKMHNSKQGSGPNYKSYIFAHLLDLLNAFPSFLKNRGIFPTQLILPLFGWVSFALHKNFSSKSLIPDRQ